MMPMDVPYQEVAFYEERAVDFFVQEIPTLTFYYHPYCPFCISVLQFLTLQGIEIECKSVQDPKYAEELIRIGGKRQVPCLVADEMTALYESKDILLWLDENVELIKFKNS